MVLTVALATAPFAEFPAWAGGDCAVDIPASCEADATPTMAGVMGGLGGSSGRGLNGGAVGQGQATGAGAAGMSQQAAKCASKQSQCNLKNCNNDKSKVAECKKAVADKAAQFNAQSAAFGQNADGSEKTASSSGAGGAGAAALLGALAGAAMGMMMAKQQQQPPPPLPPPVATGALQLNGSLNCQMADSFQYADCDTYLTQACAGYGSQTVASMPAAIPITGTVISTPGGMAAGPDCASFSARFCSPNVTPAQGVGNPLSNGAVTQVNLAGSGEGLTSPYCQNAVANNWCTDPSFGSARAVCPSCRQVASGQSPACVANPALCLGQNSPAQLTQVQNNPACAGDPLFTPGSPYATNGTALNGMVATGSMPAVILPQSAGTPIGGGNSKSTGALGSTVASGTSGASSSGGTTGSGANREGTTLSGGGASGGGSGISTSLKVSSASITNSELVAGGGVIVASGSKATSRGPASDIEAKFGPSLFVTSTQIIRQHCLAGKLLNCP